MTNVNVPFNSNTNTNAITTTWNFQNGDFQTFVGQHLFEVTSPSGQSTNSFSVTNSYAHAFTGMVVNGTNTVPNAVVFLYQSGNVVGGSVADNFGRYTVRAPVGTYALTALKANFVADKTTALGLVLTNSQTLTTNLNLFATTASISGKMVDANTGIGLPGLYLGVRSTDGARLGIGFTDSNGNFSVGVTSNKWNIGGNDAVVAFLGYVGLNNGVLVSATNGSASNLMISLPKATALFYGTLKDNLGNPLPAVRIDCGDFNGLYDNGGHTDANGYYVTGAVGGLGTNDPYSVGVYEPKNFPIYLFSQSQIGDTNMASDTTVMANFSAMYSGLVLNGGFQTEDFTYWSLSGDTNNTFVADGVYDGITPYFGQYAADLGGTSGSLGSLFQTLSTTAGASYLLSFWFNNPDADPGKFLVSWNGTTLLDTTNVDADVWTNMQFAVSATGTSTVLQFGFQDDYDNFGLDDISVVAANPDIASVSLSGTNLVLNGINGQSGGTYYVLMSTNLTFPLSQWTPVTTNDLSASGNFTITVTNTVAPNIPQRFYILETQ